MVHKYNGILFGLKKEQNSYTYYNMDEPSEHYAKLNKPITERQNTVWFHLYEVSRIVKFRQTENRMVVPMGCRGG